ncbi:hypothetical protein STIAU_3900 [Stigmatella aurantiaca DW4/3-1]|uniref:Uncharacterized protein n=1 Tax=Stigmatella aurantiaca (strain DW4/3-1) TaxID=378806 RepID=Q099G4_STIAD|nr:hypothetical protein STIAU_3900 [Stigmatella aurantiaca DW4/3-1]
MAALKERALLRAPQAPHSEGWVARVRGSRTQWGGGLSDGPFLALGRLGINQPGDGHMRKKYRYSEEIPAGEPLRLQVEAVHPLQAERAERGGGPGHLAPQEVEDGAPIDDEHRVREALAQAHGDVLLLGHAHGEQDELRFCLGGQRQVRLRRGEAIVAGDDDEPLVLELAPRGVQPRGLRAEERGAAAPVGAGNARDEVGAVHVQPGRLPEGLEPQLHADAVAQQQIRAQQALQHGRRVPPQVGRVRVDEGDDEGPGGALELFEQRLLRTRIGDAVNALVQLEKVSCARRQLTLWGARHCASLLQAAEDRGRQRLAHVPMGNVHFREGLSVGGVAQALIEGDHVGACMEVHRDDAAPRQLRLESGDQARPQPEPLEGRQDGHLEEAAFRRALGVKQDASRHGASLVSHQVEALLLEGKGHRGAWEAQRLAQHAEAQLQFLLIKRMPGGDEAQREGIQGRRRSGRAHVFQGGVRGRLRTASVR